MRQDQDQWQIFPTLMMFFSLSLSTGATSTCPRRMGRSPTTRGSWRPCPVSPIAWRMAPSMTTTTTDIIVIVIGILIATNKQQMINSHPNSPGLWFCAPTLAALTVRRTWSSPSPQWLKSSVSFSTRFDFNNLVSKIRKYSQNVLGFRKWPSLLTVWDLMWRRLARIPLKDLLFFLRTSGSCQWQFVKI